MLPRNHLRRIRIAFDDHRLVNNAGLILPATLAQHLGPATTGGPAPGLGPGPRASQHGRKAHDVCGVGPSWRRLHRRRRRAPAGLLRCWAVP